MYLWQPDFTTQAASKVSPTSRGRDTAPSRQQQKASSSRTGEPCLSNYIGGCESLQRLARLKTCADQLGRPVSVGINFWFIKSYSLLNMGRRRGANAKCVQLKSAIEADRCRYRTIAEPKKYCCGFIRDRL